MCELMTIAAAAIFSTLAIRAHSAGRPCRALGGAALAFGGAALMWSVDCVHSLIEGEGLLDLSASDAALGCLIIGCGLTLFALLRLRESLTKPVPAK